MPCKWNHSEVYLHTHQHSWNSPCVGLDVGQLELSGMAGGSVKRHSHRESSLAVCNIKHASLWPNSSVPMHLPKKGLYITVHSSFVITTKSWKRLICSSTCRETNCGIFIYLFHGILLLLSHFSRVRLCVTLQTAAHQAPPSLGFSRQEHWSGLPFPSLPWNTTQQWKGRNHWYKQHGD